MSAMSGAPTAAPGQLLGVLMSRSAPWAVGAGALSVLVLGLAGNAADLLGALLGLAIVAVFYGTDLLVLWVSRRLVPAATMGLFLGEYLVKVLAIAALLWALRDSSAVDLQATATTVVVTTVTWVAALTTAALRTRSFVLDPAAGPAKTDTGDGRGSTQNST
ncbi:MAG: hypothetical protein OEV62_03375 [Actinomycetota bacterium]|nr:hypothetical protein [Actinomycetota bacterium]